jgi:hypothetical protein
MCTSGDIIRDNVEMEELFAVLYPKNICPLNLHCKGMILEINDSTSIVSLPPPLSPSLPLLSKLVVK